MQVVELVKSRKFMSVPWYHNYHKIDAVHNFHLQEFHFDHFLMHMLIWKQHISKDPKEIHGG